MALVQISPVEARLRWDRAHLRPTELRWHGRQLEVIGLAGVRDERAAYPAERGPRLTLLLHTAGGGQASVAFDGRLRRWYLEALDEAA